MDVAGIERAARLIREGKLVAFPTETVYGLGANALDPAAVARIYEAKGRPSSSPLIVHVDSVAMARSLVTCWPPDAETLAARFWPGPLTLVLEKKSIVPDAVTSGLETVGLRVPAHPVALALVRAAGVPIAAPSANRFMQLSPTTADHVRTGLGEHVQMILDGGSTTVGIESTVLSLAGGRAVLLRPGMVSREDLEALIGPVETTAEAGKGAHASPGLHTRHYSPRTPLTLIGRAGSHRAGRGALVALGVEVAGCRCVTMPGEPAQYAAMLYGILHELDAEGWDFIEVEEPPDTPEWAAIRDRLRRASTAPGDE